MNLEIIRSAAQSSATGTFGEMRTDGVRFCAKCEQPWNDNLADHSCITPGDYRLLPCDSPSHGATVVFHNRHWASMGGRK